MFELEVSLWLKMKSLENLDRRQYNYYRADEVLDPWTHLEARLDALKKDQLFRLGFCGPFQVFRLAH